MAKILIIEDENLVRRLLRRTLELAGHNVLEACDGESGVTAYREQQTDLVITDIQMPKKDGLEVIRELRRDFPTAKIIAMSGAFESKPDLMNSVRDLGAARSLSKPLDVEEMLSTIDKMLV